MSNQDEANIDCAYDQKREYAEAKWKTPNDCVHFEGCVYGLKNRDCKCINYSLDTHEKRLTQ